MTEIRVYYEDTDLGGVVYHANYLNFCERARSELFFSRGLSPVLPGGHFVARSIAADYFKPAKFGDVLQVRSMLEEFRSASFTLRQRVERDGELLFEMHIKLVYVTHEGRVACFDAATKSMMLELLPGDDEA